MLVPIRCVECSQTVQVELSQLIDVILQDREDGASTGLLCDVCASLMLD